MVIDDALNLSRADSTRSRSLSDILDKSVEERILGVLLLLLLHLELWLRGLCWWSLIYSGHCDKLTRVWMFDELMVLDFGDDMCLRESLLHSQMRDRPYIDL